MGWLIALGIVLLLAVLPIGVRVRYNSEGIVLKVIAGPVKITLLPRPNKKKKEKKKKEKKKSKTGEASGEDENLPKPPQPPKESKKKADQAEKGGSLLDFLPLVKIALDFLGEFRRKLRLDNLYLRLILAGSDPCDLAVNYGRAWAALGNLMPQLEKWFVIKKRDIEVECDFETSQTLVIAHLDLTITLGRLLTAAAKFAVRALIEYLKIKKKRKGGAVK